VGGKSQGIASAPKAVEYNKEIAVSDVVSDQFPTE
jgi:hypothetical protein